MAVFGVRFFIFCNTKTPINSLFISVFGFPIIPYQE